MDQEEWQLRRVRVPKGTHLPDSKTTNGASRDLLNEDGTNRNLGPTESIPVDEDAFYETISPSSSGRSVGQDIAADVVSQVVAHVIAEVDWESFFKQTIAPAIRRTMGKTANRLRSAIRRTDSRASTEAAAPTPGALPDASKEEGLVVKVPTLIMSSEEYRERAIAVLAADAYAAWQREILSNARVEDDDASPELTSAINLVLGGNTFSLDDDTLAEIMKRLKESQVLDGAYVLSKPEESRKTLRPPEG